MTKDTESELFRQAWRGLYAAASVVVNTPASSPSRMQARGEVEAYGRMLATMSGRPFADILATAQRKLAER